MEAKELRTFNVEELKTRVRQWQDELFRARFKAQTTETKDTSVFRKLKRDIARGLTILNEKLRVGGTATPSASAPEATPQDQPVTAAAEAAAPKAAKKTKSATKSSAGKATKAKPKAKSTSAKAKSGSKKK